MSEFPPDPEQKSRLAELTMELFGAQKAKELLVMIVNELTPEERRGYALRVAEAAVSAAVKDTTTLRNTATLFIRHEIEESLRTQMSVISTDAVKKVHELLPEMIDKVVSMCREQAFQAAQELVRNTPTARR